MPSLAKAVNTPRFLLNSSSPYGMHIRRIGTLEMYTLLCSFSCNQDQAEPQVITARKSGDRTALMHKIIRAGPTYIHTYMSAKYETRVGDEKCY